MAGEYSLKNETQTDWKLHDDTWKTGVDKNWKIIDWRATKWVKSVEPDSSTLPLTPADGDAFMVLNVNQVWVWNNHTVVWDKINLLVPFVFYDEALDNYFSWKAGVISSFLGDVIGPAAAIDNAIAVFDGLTGKLIKEVNAFVTPTGEFDIPSAGPHNVSNGFANEVWEKTQRPTAATVGLRGVAISAESGAVTETTSTPQDAGITATITTTGRPVFVGLTCDASNGFIRGTPDEDAAAYYPFQVELYLYRDATNIYQTRQGVTAKSGSSVAPFDLAPSCVWTIDTPPAGTYDYTFRFAPSSTSGTSEASIDNIKIVAFEL